jgi:NADPH2:quinone reductase
MATMKALQMTTTQTLTLTTLPIPTPKPGQALIKVHYACIHPSDRLNAQGLFPKTTHPRIPGRDFAGEVIATNPVSAYWVGKAVYGTSGASLGFNLDGPHAEYCLVPQAALVEKPATLSMAQAATVGVPFTTALVCLRRAMVSPSDIVLVLGSTGAVGSAAVQISRAMGCKRVVTAARRVEAEPDIVLSGGEPVKELVARIGVLTSGRGVDVVVDTVGDLGLMGAAVELLAQKGRYAWIAAPRGEASKMLAFDVFQAYRKEITLVGCNSVSLSIEDAAGLLRFLEGWFGGGLLRAQDEGSFRRVRLEDSIEEGYKRSGEQVVIQMV